MRAPISAAFIVALAIGVTPLASAQLLEGLLDRDQAETDASATDADSADGPTGSDQASADGFGDASSDQTPAETPDVANDDSEDGTDSSSGTFGSFGEAFSEPTIMVDGEEVTTDQKCIEDSTGFIRCKPASGTIGILGDGRFVYLNALEGTESVELSIVAEFGEVSVNDQSRVLELDENDNPTWTRPSPVDAGANPEGNDSTTLTNGLLDTADNTAKNDGALFCADVSFLPDGRMIAVGGTDYYSEVGVDGLPVGVVELEGLKNSRIFDPETETWTQSGSMEYGRWYPTTITMPDGDLFVASGVTKLLKPVYPEDPLQSGRNVVQTETYDIETGEWTTNPASAQRSLPLFPRLHMLPNGQVYYNAGGQSFNPFGQSYDQALWNIAGAYDPDTQQWTDLGYAGLPLKFNEIGLGSLASTLNPTNINGDQLKRTLRELVGQTLTNPLGAVKQLLSTPIDGRVLERVIGSGMRGSTSSTMLPLRPDANGGYHEAEFLTAGGVPTYVTLNSPGGYLPLSSSRIDTVTTNGDDMAYESRLTGPLNRPRWYGSTVMLPNNQVMIVNGGTRDGVVVPGLENPLPQSEFFDPETETWTDGPIATRERTYHNIAMLMPDGRVIVGGHSPINTAYLSFVNLEQLGFAPYDGRDPSFEIFTPAYAERDDRPVIEDAPTEMSTNGETFTITVDDANVVDEVQLIHRNASTHLVKANQRSVVLPILSQSGNEVTLQMTGNPAVLPPGPYMLFVSKVADDGMRVPSESTPMDITVGDGVVEQPAPADTGDGDSLLSGLSIGGSENSRATGGPVSPILPVTDLLTGVLTALPSPQEAATSGPETAEALAGAGRGAVEVLLDTLVSLPEAGTGLLADLGSRRGTGSEDGDADSAAPSEGQAETDGDNSAPAEEEMASSEQTAASSEEDSGLLGGLFSAAEDQDTE